MKSSIPTAAYVSKQLQALGHAQIQDLAKRSGVPFTTLWNIRAGLTENPGLMTVKKFFPFLCGFAKS